jgi:siroheme synthase-like protein
MASTQNNLLPIFLKMENLFTLLVGGGRIAFEKLNTILNNTPKAKIRLVAIHISPEIKALIQGNPRIEVIEDEFKIEHLDDIQLVITALNNVILSNEIKVVANEKGLLYNAADKPEVCDFYLGSVVSKGNLKIGISTNGKSPTMAKRIKEVLNDSIPLEINDSIENMSRLRGHIKGNLADKIKKLNKITGSLIKRKESKWYEFNVLKIILRILGIVGILISGHILFTLLPPSSIWEATNSVIGQLDVNFLYFMLGGFIAQMIDGALGMAYGVSATTFLLSFGISPAVASMSVHFSEIFTSGVSGLMHLKFGNVHSRLFKAIVVPGVIGAIIGAYLLAEFEQYSSYIKPIVGIYTLFLGGLIIYKVVRKKQNRQKVKNAGLLAIVGGFLDSIGGGGWGPVVSSTLIARGKNPRLVVGSVNLAEFFVSLASSFTFFTLIGIGQWQTIVGLILGGVCAAPIAANLSKRLNLKFMMLLVGIVVVIVSLRIIIMTLF